MCEVQVTIDYPSTSIRCLCVLRGFFTFKKNVLIDIKIHRERFRWVVCFQSIEFCCFWRLVIGQGEEPVKREASAGLLQLFFFTGEEYAATRFLLVDLLLSDVRGKVKLLNPVVTEMGYNLRPKSRFDDFSQFIHLLDCVVHQILDVFFKVRINLFELFNFIIEKARRILKLCEPGSLINFYERVNSSQGRHSQLSRVELRFSSSPRKLLLEF